MGNQAFELVPIKHKHVLNIIVLAIQYIKVKYMNLVKKKSALPPLKKLLNPSCTQIRSIILFYGSELIFI